MKDKTFEGVMIHRLPAEEDRILLGPKSSDLMKMWFRLNGNKRNKVEAMLYANLCLRLSVEVQCVYATISQK